MQPPPHAADLLAIVAEVLDDEIVPALHGPSQHHARVAASLVAIVERELRLGPEADAAERSDLLALLGADVGPPGEPHEPHEPHDGPPGDSHEPHDHTDAELGELRSELATRLRAGLADDPEVASVVWRALIESVRADLRIVKPGHDDWDGE